MLREESLGGLRAGVIAAVFVGLVVAATGAGARLAFSEPTSLKYAVTVAAPLIAVITLAAREPLRVVVVLAVVALPFSGATATFGPLAVPLMLPILLVGAVLAVIDGPPSRRLSPLGAAAAVGALLLAPALVQSHDASGFVAVIASAGVVGWLCSRVAAEPGGTRVVLGAITATAAIQAAIAIWEFRTGSRLNLYSSAGGATFGQNYFFGFENENRPTGSFYDPISLGNVLAMSLPIAIGVAYTEVTNARRLLAGAAAALIALGLALTLSRMSWIGATAGAILCVALMPSGLRMRAGMRLAAAGAVAIVIAMSLGGAALGSRFSSVFDPRAKVHETSKGDTARVKIWHTAAKVGAEHPIAGVGLGNIGPQLQSRMSGLNTGVHAHSTYLQTWAEAGALGAAALLLLFAGFGRSVRRALRRGAQERVIAAALGGAGLALAVAFLTDVSVRYASVAGMIAAMAGVTAARGGERVRR